MLKNYKKNASPWRRWLLRTISSALFVMFVSNSYAAEMLALSTEDAFLGDIPVVLSATRLEQPRIDAPASITIIDRQLIDASGAEDVVDLLRLVPGFQLGHDKLDAWIPDPVGATYHGLSDAYARRIQVLVDGRSVYDPAIGGIRWHQLPLEIDDVERIEVIRGPNAVTYGANAFLATINIITRHPTDTAATYAKVVVGSGNYVKGFARFSQKTKSFDYRLGVSAQSDDGLETEFDSKTILKSNFRGEYRAENGGVLEILLGLSTGPYQAGEVASQTDRTTTNNSNYQQFKWKRILNADEEYQIQYYRNYFNAEDEFVTPIFGIDTVIDQSMITERNNLEFQHTRRWSDSIRTVWGLEARQDTSQAPDGWFYGIDKVSNNLYRTFINAEWRSTPKLVTNIGAMLENNGLTGTGFSPRIAVNYHLNSGHTLRASASRGLRTPSLFEEFANSRADIGGITPIYSFVSPGGLQTEKITSYELGLISRSGNSKLVTDIRLFQDYLSDLITYPENASPSPVPPFEPQYTYNNQGQASIYGIELDLNYRPTDSSRIVFAYAYANQTGNFQRFFDPTQIRPTDPATPTHTASLLALKKFNHDYTASVGVYYVGTMGWFDNPSTTPPSYTEPHVPEYTKVDFRLAKKIRGPGYEATVELVGQNLAGSYWDYTATVVADRRYYVKVRIESN